MIDFKTLRVDDLIDMLLDLKHDLAKYICMPLSMLPADASQSEIRTALRTALFETRRTGSGTKSAEEIWRTFLEEAPEELTASARFVDLDGAVNDALRLRVILQQDTPLPDRLQLLETLQRVGVVIQNLIEEWNNGA